MLDGFLPLLIIVIINTEWIFYNATYDMQLMNQMWNAKKKNCKNIMWIGSLMNKNYLKKTDQGLLLSKSFLFLIVNLLTLESDLK